MEKQKRYVFPDGARKTVDLPMTGPEKDWRSWEGRNTRSNLPLTTPSSELLGESSGDTYKTALARKRW